MKKKILLIDDEKDFCFFVKKNLEHTGNYEVMLAHDGISGITAAEKERPHLILLDILMPGVDGGDTRRMLFENETTAHIPVVFLTAIVEKSDFNDDALVKERAGHKFLAKPVTTEELVQCIEDTCPKEVSL